jgi:hypothetical protein
MFLIHVLALLILLPASPSIAPQALQVHMGKASAAKNIAKKIRKKVQNGEGMI